VDELFGSLSVDEASCERLRWYGHGERKDKSDWISACRVLQVEGTKVREMWREVERVCVKVDMKRLGLVKLGLLIIEMEEFVEEFDNWKPSNTASVR